MLVSGRPAYTVQFTLRVGDGMVELGPDAAESAQAQPFYFAEDLWSGRFFPLIDVHRNTEAGKQLRTHIKTHNAVGPDPRVTCGCGAPGI